VTAASSEQEKVLREEILADAQRHAERVLSHARREAQELRDRTRQDIEQGKSEQLEAARREAASRREIILASAAIEAPRRRNARVEAVLQGIHDEARRRLLAREGFDYREALVRLAADAIARMEGASFVLQLSEADREALGAGLAEEVRRRVGRDALQVTLAAEGAKIAGGVIVRDAEGRQVWDNSLAVRLERFWPTLRRQIGVRTGLAGASGAEKEL